MNQFVKLLNIVIFSLALIAGAGVYYFNNKSAEIITDKSVTSLSSVEVDKVVNKYIKSTSLDSYRQKMLTEKALNEAKSKIAILNSTNKIKQEKAISEIPLERQVRKDTSNKEDSYDNSEESSNNEMTAAEKKEYAKQYIESARLDGYAIELNSNLEVIKATPIRKPSQENDSTESYPSD